MEKIIACCGLNCSACDARIATMTNDNDLRARTAEKWRIQYNAADLTAEMINCTGCREEGLKLGHCYDCNIRKCAIARNFNTCAECGEMKTCEILGNVLKYVPEALENLKSLN